MIVVGVARAGSPAQVRFADAHGNAHRLMAEPLDTRDEIPASLAGLALLVVGFIFSRMYVRSKREVSLVEAGTGGRKVMIDGGTLVDGLRSVAAKMDIDQLHENRSDFVQRVQQAVAEDLCKTGLELETVALTALDQTPLDSLDENNVFNAAGMKLQAERIAESRKRRAKIESEAQVAVARSVQEGEIKRYAVEREQDQARVEQRVAMEKLAAEELSQKARAAEEAERDAAADRAAAILEPARAEAEEVTIRAQALRDEKLAEAEGTNALIAAENSLFAEIIEMRLQIERLRIMPGLMEAMVKPAEKIDRITIHKADGLGGGSLSGGGSGSGGGNAIDQAFDQICKNAVALPAMRTIGRMAGINLDGSVSDLMGHVAAVVPVNQPQAPTDPAQVTSAHAGEKA